MGEEKSTFDQMKYIKEYNRQHISYRKISFNDQNPEDKMIQEWIDTRKETTSSYLKRLVKEDMKK